MRGKHRFEVLLIACGLTTAAHAQLIEDRTETSSSTVADLIDDLRDDDRTVCREHDMPLVSEAVLNPVTGRTLHRSELFWYGNVFAHVH